MSFRGVFMLLWFDGNRLPSRNIPLSRGDLPVLQADPAFHKSSCLCDRAKANLNCCATATSSSPVRSALHNGESVCSYWHTPPPTTGASRRNLALGIESRVRPASTKLDGKLAFTRKRRTGPCCGCSCVPAACGLIAPRLLPFSHIHLILPRQMEAEQ